MKGKNIVKNLIYNVAYQLMLIFLPIVTTPYVARVLGAENIGIYSYTESIAAYFILFGSLGFALYGRREIAYQQNDIVAYSRTFWEIFFFKTLTMLIATGIFCITFAFGQSEYNLYYKILLIEIFGNILDISWFFQGLEDFKKTVLRSMVVKLVAVVCIFCFVKSPEHLYRYFLIYGLSTLLGNISLWLYLPNLLTRVKIRFSTIFRHLKPTLILFLPQIATQIYTVLDKVMLGGLISDKSEVGYYEQSQKITKILITLVTSLGIVLMPRIANLYANGDKERITRYIKTSFNVVFILALPIMFGLIAVADVFVPAFFGAGYERVALVMKIICPVVLFIGASNVVGTQYLLPVKRQKEYTVSVWCGAVVNFVFNLILIPYWGAVGAAVGTLVAELSVTAVQLFYIRKEFEFKDIIVSAGKYTVGALIMYAVLVLLGNTLLKDMSNIANVCITVAVGVVVYVLYLVIIRDSFLGDMLRRGAQIVKKRTSDE